MADIIPELQKSKRDSLFLNPFKGAGKFEFDEETASVFDDMLERSVPFYNEVQRMVGELAVEFAMKDTNIYDLGCSTGNSIVRLGEQIPKEKNISFVGVDSSQPMLERAWEKLTRLEFKHPFEFKHFPLDENLQIENASVVLLILTLQFTPQKSRGGILKKIYSGLKPNGCLILFEKINCDQPAFDDMYLKNYHDMKRRNGYSEVEIARKQEALKNVLIPNRLRDNEELLAKSGFTKVEMFFRWYNFCGQIALK